MLPVKIAIILFWVAAVIDPVGELLGIRYVALAVMLLVVLYLFLLRKIDCYKLSIQWGMVIVFAGILPIYGLLIYAVRSGGGEFIDTSYMAAGVLAIGSLLYFNKSMCDFGVKAMVLSTRVIVLMVGVLLVAQIYSIDVVVNFFIGNKIAFVGIREYSGVEFPYLYLLASPMLIMLMAYDFAALRRNFSAINFFLFALTSIALALTGTRAHLLMAVTFALLYLILIADQRRLLKMLIFIVSFVPFIFVFDVLESLLASFFSPVENSNSIKLSMLTGYSEIFSNPLMLIFGQGFNAHEWSSSLLGMIATDIGASKTELTYLEIIRVFGIVVGLFFLMFLCITVYATRNLSLNYEWVRPGLMLLLVNASINPYLFSTNGILPLGLVVAIISNNAFSKMARGGVACSLVSSRVL